MQAIAIVYLVSWLAVSLQACTIGTPYTNGTQLKSPKIYLDGEQCGDGRCKVRAPATRLHSGTLATRIE